MVFQPSIIISGIALLMSVSCIGYALENTSSQKTFIQKIKFNNSQRTLSVTPHRNNHLQADIIIKWYDGNNSHKEYMPWIAND